MGFTQSNKYLSNHVIGANHLNAIFRHALKLIDLSDKRRAARQGSKLSFTKRLPGTGVVIAHAPGTCVKYRSLHRLDMAFRNKEHKFMHADNLSPEFNLPSDFYLFAELAPLNYTHCNHMLHRSDSSNNFRSRH